jgi:ZIP family zinc transporter
MDELLRGGVVSESKQSNLKTNYSRLPLWLSALLPFLALAGMLAFFVWGEPLALFTQNVPPVEILSFGPVQVTDDGFEVNVVNGGPEPVRIAQVTVDDAYWEYEVAPAPQLPRYGSAELTVYYPWIYGEPHRIQVVTSTGLTFETDVQVAVPTPKPGLREFLAFGLIGIYVGVIPVGLGMLWFPALRRLNRKWVDAVLALTIGLLFFLLIDTSLEGFEAGRGLPKFLQGGPLVIFAGTVTWLALMAVRSSGATNREGQNRKQSLARLIAVSIGLHNLGEGLAIGAAFALGEAALGSFLIVGFTLHNITEGIGISAPLLPRKSSNDHRMATVDETPGLLTFLGLMLLAGAPAIIGAWIGGFAYSPLLSTLFLGVGVGAILQVIVEVGGLLYRNAQRESESLTSWANTGGFTLGLLIMYVTAFLVSF